MEFVYEKFLTEKTYGEINEIKTFHPEIIETELMNREKAPYRHQTLVFAAADHNARMITAYKGNPIGLANRREYLSRLTRILISDSVDGVESTADVIEDLVAINYISKRDSGVDFLKNKQIIGTINRGGLLGVAWEMDDICSCYTVEKLARMNLDGLKFMLRINPDRVESKNTLAYCAEIVNQAEKYNLPVYLEGLFVKTENEKHILKTELEYLVQTVGVVSALGSTSLRKWIELPLNEQYKVAVGASTCSFLVVPDEKEEVLEEILKEYTKESIMGGNVRGILLGRNVLYGEEDPYYIATAIADTWHTNTPVSITYETSKEKVVISQI